jgi:hypothetical protein
MRPAEIMNHIDDRRLSRFLEPPRVHVYASSFLLFPATQQETVKSSVSQSRFGQEMHLRRVFPLFRTDSCSAVPVPLALVFLILSRPWADLYFQPNGRPLAETISILNSCSPSKE